MKNIKGDVVCQTKPDIQKRKALKPDDIAFAVRKCLDGLAVEFLASLLSILNGEPMLN